MPLHVVDGDDRQIPYRAQCSGKIDADPKCGLQAGAGCDGDGVDLGPLDRRDEFQELFQ